MIGCVLLIAVIILTTSILTPVIAGGIFAPDYAFASSPVLEDGLLIIFANRSVFAFDPESGEPVWDTWFDPPPQNSGEEAWSTRLRYGSCIAAGEVLILLTEQGDLITARVDPSNYSRLTEADLSRGLY